MARYFKVFPLVDDPAGTFPDIRSYLNSKGFHETTLDGQKVFQKGDGVWLAARYIRLTYFGGYARLEAWVDVMGGEEGLDGFVGSAPKKSVKKVLPVIEEILTRRNESYQPPEPGEMEPQVFCAKCGARQREGAGYCPNCGYIFGEPVRSPGNANSIPAGVRVTKQEYLKKYAGESFNKNLKITAIVGYVLCGIQALAVLANPYVLIDLAICLGLTLGLHLGRSKGCAIGMLVYFGVSLLLNLLSSGILGGWGWLIVGIYGLNIIRNAEKQYEQLMQS